MTTFQTPSKFTAPKPSELAEENALVAVELLEKQPGIHIDGDGPLDAARVNLLVVDGTYAGYADERQFRNAALVRVLNHTGMKPGDVLVARMTCATTTNGRQAVVFADADAHDRKAGEQAWSAHASGAPAQKDEPPF